MGSDAYNDEYFIRGVYSWTRIGILDSHCP